MRQLEDETKTERGSGECHKDGEGRRDTSMWGSRGSRGTPRERKEGMEPVSQEGTDHPRGGSKKRGKPRQGLPWWLKKLPSKAGDMGPTPGLGMKIPRASGQLSPEKYAARPGALALQQEKPVQGN